MPPSVQAAPSFHACWRLGMTSGTQGVIGRGRWQVTGVNVELTEMVETNNGATFQCYFAKARSFDGIFLNSVSKLVFLSRFP